MAQSATCQPVDISIFASTSPGMYPVGLDVPGWRVFPRARLKLDLTHLLSLEADPTAYGEALGQALFAADVLGRAYQETQAVFQAGKRGLRVRLRLDPAAAELHALHWERIFHPLSGGWQPLGMTADTPFSRHVFIKDFKRAEPESARPLQVLAVIASPSAGNPYSLAPIPEEQRQALHHLLGGLPGVRVAYLESGTQAPPTLGQLRQALADGYHMVHLLCHGAVLPGGTVLYLEEEGGEIKGIPEVQLVSEFAALAQKPLFCFLAACETASETTGVARAEAYVPLGPALVEQGGVHAVVAMFGRVGMDTASAFTAQFYRRLLGHGAVDLAVNQARAQVRDRWDWGAPVLFSRLPDNQLLTPQAEEIDLRPIEAAYRQRVRERFGGTAAFYIPLLGEAVEAAPVEPDVFEWVQRGQQVERVKLPSMRAAVDKYPCIILLGDPGSGKTTALQDLAYQMAGESGQLPLPVSLGEFVPGQSVETFLDGYWGGTLGHHWRAPELANHLQDYLPAGRLLLLCDGLNEMPREGYAARVADLRRFIDQWVKTGNRFMVTCRVLDYGAELDGLQRVEVQPFNDQQIRACIQQRLPDRWEGLWQALSRGQDAQHRLLELARNPLNLTIMAAIYRRDGQLSQNRAGLLQRFSEILLEQAKKKCPAEEWLPAGIQRAALAALAYELGERSGFGTSVETVLALGIMPEQVQLHPNYPAVDAPPQQVLKLAAGAHILEMPGIAPDSTDRSSVRFYHQLLQEYFAALELRRRAPQADAATQARWWRWPWREAEMPLWNRPKDNYDPLPAPPPTGWEETTILAAGLAQTPENDDQLVRALLAVNPVLAGRCLHEGQARVAPEVRQVVIEALLAALGDDTVALRVRIAAGEVLGYLG
ncbi:MAG: CHAT domain-containing protein, partial [Armatimonadetes bacterium]|nr:CHAT domain-containing protein [Armatimonadota bacterium]